MRSILLLFALVAAAPLTGYAAQPAPSADPAVAAAQRHRQEKGAEILGDFADLLSLPNVYPDIDALRKTATWIQGELASRGIDAKLLEAPRAAPIVFGELRVPGAQRTIAIYAHYDGQPVDPSQWTTDPWTPTLHDRALSEGGAPIPFPSSADAIDPEWRLYARSAGDDKAPVVAILAALDALDRAGLTPTSNIKFFFEGEEEASSVHLRTHMILHRELLDADLWLICDGPVHQSRRPQLVFGVRGVTNLEITIYGAQRYLHSGHYGNWAPNPAMMLAQLLASMKDDEGNVIVPGFYDTTSPLSAAERAALAALPDIDDDLKRELALARTEGAPQRLGERLLLPSLNVRGMVSAAVGPMARNIVPTHAVATIDLRLVKGNDPEAMKDVVEAHIEGRGYTILRHEPTTAERLAHPRIAKVRRGGGYRAVRTRMDLPVVAPVARAVRRAAGEAPLMVPSLGGSLPLYLFEDILEAPLVVVPIANHDNNQHAPDENLRVANLWYGVDLMAALLTME